MMTIETPFLADVVAEQFLPYPIGFAFLFFVLIAESALISRLLSRTVYDKKIWTTIIISNLLTTLLGLVIYKQPAGLLSYTSVDSYSGVLLFKRAVSTFITSFLMTLAVELPFNVWRLHKFYPIKNILSYSLLANLLTYLVAVLIYLVYANSLL
jgi:hypothetical protein